MRLLTYRYINHTNSRVTFPVTLSENTDNALGFIFLAWDKLSPDS